MCTWKEGWGWEGDFLNKPRNAVKLLSNALFRRNFPVLGVFFYWEKPTVSFPGHYLHGPVYQ